MKILSLNNKYSAPLCIALGFFDCIHEGHKKLIDKTISMAKASKSKSCVITFVNNPDAYLRGEGKLIFSYDERLSILESMGVDCVFGILFDKKFAGTDKNSFLLNLTQSFCVKGFVCGYDYSFGANAEGNAEFLADFSQKNSIMCEIVQPVLKEGRRISSSYIRSLIAEGKTEAATDLLGHAYFMDGIVCHGRGVGSAYDFPTANLQIDSDKLLPQSGVYATVTTVDNKRYKSVTNVGAKPTFGLVSESVETMIINFNGDLYGKTVRVEFVRKLRDIKKFASPLDLKRQITSDAQWR